MAFRESVGHDKGRSPCRRVEFLAAMINKEGKRSSASISDSCSCGLHHVRGTQTVHCAVKPAMAEHTVPRTCKVVGPMGPGMPAIEAKMCKCKCKGGSRQGRRRPCRPGLAPDLPSLHTCFFRDLTAGARLNSSSFLRAQPYVALARRRHAIATTEREKKYE